MTMLPTSELSDAQLVDATKRLLASERATVAQVVVHIAEIELRRIHLAAGCPSLYAYCVEELHLSEHEALNRIEAARAGRTYPRILAMLAGGTLTLTTVQLLARKLTPDNHEVLLSEAAGRSKKEVLELLARHFPQPAVPTTLRKLPSAMAPVPHTAGTDAPSAAPAPPPAPPAGHRPSVAPLAPDRYKVTFTADGETRDLLELAADMLSHVIPNSDPAAVIKRALWVKHAVWVRDGGRCRFVGTNGRRCDSRRFVEFHHVISRANGGKGTVENTELRCGPHNRYEDDVQSGALARRLLDRTVARSGTSTPPGAVRPAAAPGDQGSTMTL